MASLRKSFFFNLIYSLATKYPTASNLSYFWNFGVFALVALVIQIVSGILLVMHYTPSIDYAFISCDHIMRDVNAGWILRYLHANGASIFFIVVYAHILRGLIQGSYLFSRELLWCSGVLILLLMIITAFLGYILPWGQMSLWGATVITNLASTIPVFGESIVLWLWGGFSVANPTLQKFFALHFVAPFIILALVALHVYLLHAAGSSNPLGRDYYLDKVGFTPYYTIKDFYSLFIFFMVFAILVFFIPNVLGHPDNYIPANSDVTPDHIVPEWYFLPFYAILRAIPDKAFGVLALLMSIVLLFFLPFLHTSYIRSTLFKPSYKLLCFVFIAVVFLLGYLGAKPIEEPFLFLAQTATKFYFSFFFIVLFVEKFDQFLLKAVFIFNFPFILIPLSLFLIGQEIINLNPETLLIIFSTILVVYLIKSVRYVTFSFFSNEQKKIRTLMQTHFYNLYQTLQTAESTITKDIWFRLGYTALLGKK